MKQRLVIKIVLPKLCHLFNSNFTDTIKKIIGIVVCSIICNQFMLGRSKILL